MSRSNLFAGIVLLTASIISVAFAADDYAAWNFSRKIFINTSSTGANTVSNIFYTPVLIRIDPVNFGRFYQTLPGGADIRFAKTNGVHLSYQIERWVDNPSNNDTAEIWVAVDTVYGNNATQSIVMYWGNPNAADSSNDTMTFRKDYGYGAGMMGAWHLGGNLLDATGNRNDGIDSGTVDTSGIIGNGRSFDGIKQFFSVGDLADRPSGTISFWFRPKVTFGTSSATTQGIWGKKEADSTDATISLQGSDFQIGKGTGKLLAKMEYANKGKYVASTASSFVAGTWYYVAWRWNGASDSLFINGTFDGIDSGGSIGGAGNDEIGRSFYDGNNITGGGPRYFNGTIDEFRIENFVHSASWVKFCYENQKINQTAVSFGAASSANLTWDTSAATGIQPGDGTWGTDAYWSLNGTYLSSWPGVGNTATFGGSDGTYSIKVNGIQQVDSVAFVNSGYTISGGTAINLGTKNGLYVASGKSAVISTVVTGTGGGLVKSGAGTLTLSGVNTYLGATTVAGGVLLVNGSLSATSTVTVAAGAVLGGNGTIGGAVNVNDGTIAPGGSTPGKLRTGALSLKATSVVNIRVGAKSDTVAVTGALVLNGTVNIIPVAGFVPNNYRIFTCTGTLTKTALAVGALPAGMKCTFTVASGYVDAAITAQLVTVEPKDTTVIIGKSAGFSPTFVGAGTFSFLWQRFPGDSVGSSAAYSIASVTNADTGRYRCIVKDSFNLDTTQWVRLKVIDTPKLVLQPRDTALTVGKAFALAAVLVDTFRCSYEWWKVGAAASLSTKSTLSIAAVAFTDDGRYYCIIKNPAATITSDTVRLTVNHLPPVITRHPESKTLLVGESVRFSVTASGTGTITYAWRKLPSSNTLGTDSLFVLTNVTLADSGKYYCIVTNPGGSVYTDTVLLTTRILPPKPRAVVTPKSGIVPLTVTFMDSSTGGPVASRIWRFGDKSDNDTNANVEHLYADTGKYTATLVVSGPGGVDSAAITITVSSKEKNPLQIMARQIKDTDIEVTIDNLALVDTSLPAPFCDFVGIVAARDTFPIKGIDTAVVAVYHQSKFKKTSLIDTITLPPGDSVFGLMTVLFWNDKTTSEYTNGNGCMVYLHSKVLPNDTAKGNDSSKQIVSFLNTATENSAVSVLGGKVTVWKDSKISGVSMPVDTLQKYSFTPPAGFTVAGVPVRFLNPGAGPPLYVGIHIDSLPKGTSIDDVRIYRESAGTITVEYESVIDSAKGIVYVNTTDRKRAFVAMIDSKPPQVKCVTFTNAPVNAVGDVVDTVTVFDNCRNVRWKYLYSAGNEMPSVRDSGEMQDTGSTLRLVISHSSGVISEEYGMRAFLVVNDAVYRDTINLTRSVHRDNSDKLVIAAGLWCPVFATANLAHNEPDSLTIPARSKDPRRAPDYRLFQWAETDQNVNDESKWIEYDPNDKGSRSHFALAPGKLFWLKTRYEVRLNLGPGSTMPLGDTFTVNLPAKQFTDFGMPFRFGVSIGDIRDATGKDAESVQIYRWVSDTATKRYRCEPYYLNNLPGSDDPSKLLEFENVGGYSLYNSGAAPVTLRIPPIPGKSTLRKAVGKKKCDREWSACLLATADDGFHFQAIQCGFTPVPGTMEFPVTPGFENVGMYLVDKGIAKKQAHYISNDAADGIARELRCTNSSDVVKRVSYQFNTIGELPSGFEPLLFDVADKSFTDKGMIAVEPHSTVSRWVVVGDKNWRASFSVAAATFQYRLTKVYPNPARSIVNICYSVPMSATEQLLFSIFDLKGRLIWTKEITTPQMSGNHSITWNGTDRSQKATGAGMYLVRFSVVDNKGKAIRRFEQRIAYFP